MSAVDLSQAKKFQFIAGNLALNFCNTVGGKRGVVVREHLDSPLALVAWSHQAGLFDERIARRYLELAAVKPDEGAEVVARAVALREALFRMFKPGSSEGRLGVADLELLNSILAQSLGRMQLVRAQSAGGDFVWKWTFACNSLDEPLGPLAHSAATLLTDSHKLSHIRMCQGDTCGWLFVDSSKNHSRCWCDMRDCGNRAKIRRHRLKQKGSKSC